MLDSWKMIKTNISSIQEDYLEAILILQNKFGLARLTDISQHLGLCKSTVSTTLQLLKRQKLVLYEPYRKIDLTSKGVRIARQILKRHKALRSFLIKVLLLDEKLADETACKMEHGLSSEALERFVKFTEFVEKCPYSDKSWLNGFGYFCTSGCFEKCDQCQKVSPSKRKNADDK